MIRPTLPCSLRNRSKAWHSFGSKPQNDAGEFPRIFIHAYVRNFRHSLLAESWHVLTHSSEIPCIETFQGSRDTYSHHVVLRYLKSALPCAHLTNNSFRGTLAHVSCDLNQPSTIHDPNILVSVVSFPLSIAFFTATSQPAERLMELPGAIN